MKTFLAWGVEETIMHEVYYFANKIQHILCIFYMLATYKLKQIMWHTTISVQYFTAQVPEKISELKAKVKLTRRLCFQQVEPTDTTCTSKACYQSFQSSGYLSWKILEDLMGG